MFSTIKKGLLATTMIVSAGVAAQSVAAADMVALLLPENVNPRWEQQDAAAFVRMMAKARRSSLTRRPKKACQRLPMTG